MIIQKLYSKHRFHSKIYSLKDGKPLAEDARVAVNKDGGPNGSYEITIKKVQAGDAGTYSVVATNSFGKAECSAKIGCKGKIFQLQFFSYPIFSNIKQQYNKTIQISMLLTFIVFGQMPRMCLHYSRDVKRLLEREKSQPLHGSNLVKNLTLKIGSRFCSKMRKILLPWYSNISTLKMLDFTPALLPHLQEKYHARPSLLLTGESLKC